MLVLVIFSGLCADLQPDVVRAAEAHGVPPSLLAAVTWHASRFDPGLPSNWGGFGPLDLRDDEAPTLDEVAAVLGEAPEVVAIDTTASLHAGAAWLARQETLVDDAVPPGLERWVAAARGFSRSANPSVQERYLAVLRATLARGLDEKSPTGEQVVIVAHPDLDADLVSPWAADRDGIEFEPACSWWPAARDADDIRQIVIHTTQGRYAGALDWFGRCRSNVSAHYVVRSVDGHVTQLVSERDIAFHAGNRSVNARSIGIEHEGWVQHGRRWYTEPLYRSSARLVADIVSRTGIPADRAHIVGHGDVPGARHKDPGRFWDWDRYLGYVHEELAKIAIVGDVRGVVRAGDPWQGAPVPGAIVWIDADAEPQEAGADGGFAFEGLEPGVWTVHATAAGFDEATCTATVAHLGSTWCTPTLTEDALPAPGPREVADDDAQPPRERASVPWVALLGLAWGFRRRVRYGGADGD